MDNKGIGLASRASGGGDTSNNTTLVDEEMAPLNITHGDNTPAEKMTAYSSFWSLWSAKNASLFALVLQQSGLVLMIRYSRTIGEGADHISYIPSVVVVSAEVLKFLLNWTLEITIKPDGATDSIEIWKAMVSTESLKLLVPALLYLTQNNLLFVALKNLSVPVYQVLNQGKLFTTAFFSRLLLDKKISYCQYFSLLMLAAGVVIVQQSAINKDPSNSSTNEGNPWVGFFAVLFSCFTSGFATVYFEKVLKQKTAAKKQLSVYVRNMQLAFWSIGLGAIPIVMTDDWEKVEKDGLFQGYTLVVLIVIVFQAITGLLVGFVMKYADAVMKGFATSVAVVLATILSIVIFHDNVNLLFLVGSALVISAVRTYTNNPPVNKRVPSGGGEASDAK
jgi:UDP-sugar transporter A1/2/3